VARIGQRYFIFGDPVNWDDLKVFLAVASAGSLAGGARRLNVSQATTWRRIRALEDSLKVTLFERKATGYVLTAVGSNLLDAVDGVQRTIDAASGRLTELPDALSGEVRVAAPEFMALLLARRLPELAHEHPQLVVELLAGSPAAGLMVRDVDVAIRAERMVAGGFTLEATFAVAFGLYAAPAYLRRHGRPRAIDDLKGHRLIGFDHSMAHVAPKPGLRAGGRGAAIAFRSNSPHARLLACSAGLGLAMLPEPFARHASGIRPALPSAQVGALYVMLFVSAALRREPRVTAVRDFLLRILRDETREVASAR